MSKYYLEDQALLKYIQRDKRKIRWQAIFDGFRIPFVNFFNTKIGISIAEAEEHYGKSFSNFYQNVQDNRISLGNEKHLLFEFLKFGILTHYSKKETGELTPENEAMINDFISKQKYTESDILVSMLAMKNQHAYRIFDQVFRSPSKAFLVSKLGQMEEDSLEEIFNNSLTILSEKINKGELKLPMNALLKTYFFSILYFQGLKHRGIENKSKNHTELEQEIEDFEEQQVSGFELNLRNTVIETYQYEDEVALLKKVWSVLENDEINKFDKCQQKNKCQTCKKYSDCKKHSGCHKYLTMRYLEKFSHQEIADKESLTIENSKVKIFRCMKKVKDLLILKTA